MEEQRETLHIGIGFLFEISMEGSGGIVRNPLFGVQQKG